MFATVVLIGVLTSLFGAFGERVEFFVTLTTGGGALATALAAVAGLRALDWRLGRYLAGEDTPVSIQRYVTTGALIGATVGGALLLVDALLLGA